MRLLVRKQASIVTGGCVDARNISAAIASHPRAEIVASCAAQRAATPVYTGCGDCALALRSLLFPA